MSFFREATVLRGPHQATACDKYGHGEAAPQGQGLCRQGEKR